MRVLVTGGSGFVGQRLLRRLARLAGVLPVAGVRDAEAWSRNGLSCEQLLLGDLAEGQVDANMLQGVDVLVHAAARVHVMDELESDPQAAFRKMNVTASVGLAEAAARAGVKRFIFISSIKVNGEETVPGQRFTAEDLPSPVDPYGISKYEAEQGLRQVCERTGMEWVVVRPPLVYGPGVKANFQRLMHSLRRGLPLPVAALHNQRSLVALDNLVDLLVTCLDHPHAANEVFMVSDGDDLSVRSLAEGLARLLGSRSWLLPVPAGCLRAGLRLLGRAAVAQRLCGELRVDMDKTCTLLGWQPPLTVDEALAGTVAHYLESRG